MAATKEEQQARMNQLAMQAHSGNYEAYADLLLAMLPMLYRKTARFAGGGVEQEDLVQEGAIGLMKAVARYDPQAEVPFTAFAALCAERQMISAVRAASRYKNTPAQPSVSISELQNDLPSGTSSNPEEILLLQEKLRTVFNEADKKLSPLEKKVLAAYLEFVSYDTVAAKLGLSLKSVDNAMQRIRRKLRRSDHAT